MFEPGRADLLTVPVDPVTQLLSRGSLERRALELAHQSALAPDPVALVLAVVDVAGEDALGEVARVVRCALRAYDLCYHLGRGELVVLAPGARDDEARDLAQRLAAAVAAEPCGDAALRFGVAGTAPGEAFDLARLLARAHADLAGGEAELRAA